MNNRERLMDLMIEHALERREIASLLSVDTSTVDHWLLPRESHHNEDVPTMAVELLEYKLRER